MRRAGNATLETMLLIPLTVVVVLGILGLLQFAAWQQGTQAAATGAARAAAVWLAEDPGRAPDEAAALARGWVALTLGAEAACSDGASASDCVDAAWAARSGAAQVELSLTQSSHDVTVVVRFSPPDRRLGAIAGLGDAPIEAVAAAPLPWREPS